MSILVTSGGGVVTLGGGVVRRIWPGTVHVADSPELSAVAARIASAVPGDTVIVPSGSATWESTLTIDKRIWLIGGGAGQTNITAAHSSGYLINYLPADTLSSNFFRLSGFTFDADGGERRFFRATRAGSTPSWMRIDHNTFTGFVSASTVAMWDIVGAMWGVVDHNTFGGTADGQKTHIDNLGLLANWTDSAFTPGSANNLYYEDNLFTFNDTLFTGGHGGRYALRYNTLTLNGTHFPLLDAHGNQPGELYCTMGVEIYGNRVVTEAGYSNMGYFFDHRGGKAIVAFNKVLATTSFTCQVRDEYADSIATYPTNPVDGSPQRPNEGYYWNNRRGASGTTLFHAVESTDVEGAMAENQNWWNHTDSFDGSGGVGHGTLAARPESATNPGCAYWATTQDCTAISDDHVGADPVTPLSGTLYRWTGAAWVPFWTPYTYPHPFQGVG